MSDELSDYNLFKSVSATPPALGVRTRVPMADLAYHQPASVFPAGFDNSVVLTPKVPLGSIPPMEFPALKLERVQSTAC